jgi:hypothetical protein
VRIVDVRETVVPIKSEIRNAHIDFRQMTVSVVALVTDADHANSGSFAPAHCSTLPRDPLTLLF